MSIDNRFCCCFCCKMDVKKGASVITILAILYYSVAPFWVLVKASEMSVSTATFEIIIIFISSFTIMIIVAYLLVSLALKRNNHRLMLPYLIIAAFLIVIELLTLIALIGLLIADFQPEHFDETMEEKFKHFLVKYTVQYEPDLYRQKNVLRKSLLFMIAYTAIHFAFEIWFYSVIYRAYKALKNEQMTQQSMGLNKNQPTA